METHEVTIRTEPGKLKISEILLDGKSIQGVLGFELSSRGQDIPILKLELMANVNIEGVGVAVEQIRV